MELIYIFHSIRCTLEVHHKGINSMHFQWCKNIYNLNLFFISKNQAINCAVLTCVNLHMA